MPVSELLDLLQCVEDENTKFKNITSQIED